MTFSPETTEGIILKSFPFQEHHRILTVMTPDLGLIKLFVPHANHTLSNKHFLQTFNQVELIYTKSKGDLLYYKDGCLLKQYCEIQDPASSQLFLHYASQLIHSLTASQFPEQPSARLYQLLHLYLQTVLSTNYPQNLVSSFQLKLLLHDGLFTPRPSCGTCHALLQEATFFEGELFCPSHVKDISAIPFTSQEFSHLLIFATSRSFKDILSYPIPEPLFHKIHTLFDYSIQNG